MTVDTTPTSRPISSRIFTGIPPTSLLISASSSWGEPPGVGAALGSVLEAELEGPPDDAVGEEAGDDGVGVTVGTDVGDA